MACIHCGEKFVRKSKGFCRHSAINALKDSPLAFQLCESIASLTLDDFEDEFFCSKCYALIQKIQKSNDVIQSSLEELDTYGKCQTPQAQATGTDKEVANKHSPVLKTVIVNRDSENQSASSQGRQAKRRKYNLDYMSAVSVSGFRAQAMHAISCSNYRSALNYLLETSKSCKKIFIKKTSRIAHLEARCFLKMSTEMNRPLSVDDVKSFPWGKINEEIKKSCPCLHAVLESAIMTTKQDESAITRQVVLLVCIILHFLHPSKFKLLQSVISVHLWRSGCNKVLYPYLRNLGLSVGVIATKTLVAKLKEDADDDFSPAEDLADEEDQDDQDESDEDMTDELNSDEDSSDDAEVESDAAQN